MRPTRAHPGYFAFLAHRLSGIALALFLPMHFLALGTALADADRFDAVLRFAELPAVKAAEWGLVVLLAVHLGLGLRVLALETLPWRGQRLAAIGWTAALAMVCGAAFVAAQ